MTSPRFSAARIGTAFLPVADPVSAASWYAEAFGFRVREATEWSAVLEADGDGDGATLTLLGSASGIRATPGLDWATHNIVVPDLAGARSRVARSGAEVGDVEGDADVCLFFTTRDRDGNVLLICDR